MVWGKEGLFDEHPKWGRGERISIEKKKRKLRSTKKENN